MKDLMQHVDVRCGDVLKELRKLPSNVADCVVTSPPYWQLRDYGFDGQLGLEPDPRQFIRNLVKVFRQVRRVLKDEGTLWVNMGDAHVTRSIAVRGFPLKGKMMMPHRLAIALQDDGWYMRQDIVWHKQQPQPETVSDRPTTAHEYLFLLSKSERYFYDADAIAEPCSPNTNARSAAAKALRPSEVRDMGGVNAKVRMGVPSGWATGEGHVRSAVEYSQRPLRGPKQNASMASAIVGAVEMRNKRSVWPCYTDRMDLKLCKHCQTVYTSQSFGALDIVGHKLPDGTHISKIRCRCGEEDAWLSHFAAFGAEWIEPCILAGCPEGGTVLDCFAGTGTTAGAAVAHLRKAILIEGNPDYIPLIPHRVEQVVRRLRQAPAPPPVAPGQLNLLDQIQQQQ